MKQLLNLNFEMYFLKKIRFYKLDQFIKTYLYEAHCWLYFNSLKLFKKFQTTLELAHIATSIFTHACQRVDQTYHSNVLFYVIWWYLLKLFKQLQMMWQLNENGLENSINDVSYSVGRFHVSLKNCGLCSFGIGEGNNWGKYHQFLCW